MLPLSFIWLEFLCTTLPTMLRFLNPSTLPQLQRHMYMVYPLLPHPNRMHESNASYKLQSWLSLTQDLHCCMIRLSYSGFAFQAFPSPIPSLEIDCLHESTRSCLVGQTLHCFRTKHLSRSSFASLYPASASSIESLQDAIASPS